MTQHWGSLGLLLIRKQKRSYYKLSQQASCEHVIELVRYKPVKGWWWSYEYMKIIYMNYGVKNYMKDDHRSYRRNFCSCEKKYVFINLKKASTLYWSCRISIEPVVKLMWQIQIYAVTPCIKKKNGSVCFKRYWYPIFSLKQSSTYLADTMEGPVDVQVPNTVFCRRNFSYSETCMKRFN